MLKSLLMSLALTFISIIATADEASWSVKVLGPNNGLLPILGPKVDVGNRFVQLDAMDRELSESMRNECVIIRPEDDLRETKWPQETVGIESFTITPSYSEIIQVVPGADRADLYGYVSEELGAGINSQAEKEMKLSLARLKVKGHWIMNIDLYGGGRVLCRMPIQADDLAMVESEESLMPVPQRQDVENRAREALNQFFLVRLMTLPPDVIASHK